MLKTIVAILCMLCISTTTAFATPYETPLNKDLQTLSIFTTERILTTNDYKQIYCIANAAYAEARGEGEKGMKAVSSVIINRIRSPLYENTPCGVVNSPGQFTYNHKAKITDSDSYTKAVVIATISYLGLASDITHGATMFHTSSVHPPWGKHMVNTACIGHHLFYRYKVAT